MSATLPSALFDQSDPVSPEAHFVVRSKAEVVSILRSLIGRVALITVDFGGPEDFIVTALLALDERRGRVLFDCAADATTNARLLSATKLRFATELDHIRIGFAADSVEVAPFESRPALSIRLPETLTRLQRREDYRVRVPIAHSLLCMIRLDSREREGAASIRIYDVSGGGIALIGYPASLGFRPGQLFRACQIDLPWYGRVTTDLEIIHLQEKPRRNAGAIRLCGCRFKNLSGAMLALIHRYVTRVERDRSALT